MSLPAEEADLDRRFGGVNRLYGEAAAKAFAGARICVVGVGGVGSWAVEALARTAVGAMTLVDLDMIAESNTNRQIHALGNAYGMAKVEAMHDRVRQINPTCQVSVIEDFVSAENADAILLGHDVVLDAIDNVRVKTAMAVVCRQRAIPLVMCGGAGGKTDPRQIAVDDLSRTVQDPLLAKVRAALRKQHGFPRDPKKRFGIEAIFSHEPVQKPVACDIDGGPHGLSCAGYGSGVTVTATVGFLAAARVLAIVADRARLSRTEAATACTTQV